MRQNMKIRKHQLVSRYRVSHCHVSLVISIQSTFRLFVVNVTGLVHVSVDVDHSFQCPAGSC